MLRGRRYLKRDSLLHVNVLHQRSHILSSDHILWSRKVLNLSVDSYLCNLSYLLYLLTLITLNISTHDNYMSEEQSLKRNGYWNSLGKLISVRFLLVNLCFNRICKVDLGLECHFHPDIPNWCKGFIIIVCSCLSTFPNFGYRIRSRCS